MYWDTRKGASTCKSWCGPNGTGRADAAGDLVVRAEAGVTLGQLSKVLAEKGQRLALDGPAAATVGGVVATGAAGPLRLRYGTPRDLLIGITVVRPDGRVAHSGGKSRQERGRLRHREAVRRVARDTRG